MTEIFMGAFLSGAFMAGLLEEHGLVVPSVDGRDRHVECDHGEAVATLVDAIAEE